MIAVLPSAYRHCGTDTEIGIFAFAAQGTLCRPAVRGFPVLCARGLIPAGPRICRTG